MIANREKMRIIFLHHSVGRNLIRQGGVRDLVARWNEPDNARHEFWDHDYNEIGLTGPSGEHVGLSFGVPGDNTDPDGLAVLFSQPVHDPPDNALSHLLSFDVIIFKSCFPASAIHSQAQLEHYRRRYLAIRETLARYPDKLFIVVSPPPLAPCSFIRMVRPNTEAGTNAQDALRARQFSSWLVSEEYLQGLPNIAAFDLFDLLAAPSNSGRHANMLRAGYRSGRLGLDSHPNHRANVVIAPIFVEAIRESIKRFQQHGALDTLDARQHQESRS